MNNRFNHQMHGGISGFVLMICVLLAPAAMGDAVTFGPYSFSDSDDSVTFQQFDSSWGPLVSIVFSVTDFTASETLILDIDDSVGGFSVADAERQAYVSVGMTFVDPVQVEVYWTYVLLSGSCSTGNDTDGAGTRDGGTDEISWSVSFPSSSGTSPAQTDSGLLTYFTGGGTVTLDTGPSYFSTYYSAPGRTIEEYSGNITFSGDVYVSYNYVPEPGTAGLFALGVLALGIRARRRNTRAD